MIKSNIKYLSCRIGRKVLANGVYKRYWKNGVETLKQGVAPTTITAWCNQGYAPIAYHESIVGLSVNRGLVDMDALYMDIRNENFRSQS